MQRTRSPFLRGKFWSMELKVEREGAFLNAADEDLIQSQEDKNELFERTQNYWNRKMKSTCFIRNECLFL